MPRYLVTIEENRELTYLVEADSRDEAVNRAGSLWCDDAEPVKSDCTFDVAFVEETD